jgi:hypothetical protein
MHEVDIREFARRAVAGRRKPWAIRTLKKFANLALNTIRGRG